MCTEAHAAVPGCHPEDAAVCALRGVLHAGPLAQSSAVAGEGSRCLPPPPLPAAQNRLHLGRLPWGFIAASPHLGGSVRLRNCEEHATCCWGGYEKQEEAFG